MSRPAAFQFLLKGDEGNPFIATRFWVVAEVASSDKHAWGIAFEEPSGLPAGASLEVTDIKSWMLFDSTETRYMSWRIPGHKTPGIREVPRDLVVERYIAAIWQRLPAGKRRSQPWLLVPSVRDVTSRARYVKALKKNHKNAQLLPEPEMVVEYFRLVRRELVLEKGHNNILLVIDIGASTCNMTFVMSRREGTITAASEGKQRANRIRAVRGDAAAFAGRWVDEQLARSFSVDFANLPAELRTGLLTAVEQAKVQASVSGRSSPLSHPLLPGPATVEPAELRALSEQLWRGLAPLASDVRQRLYQQMTASRFARDLNQEKLAERGVSSEAEAYRLVDAVLLAGGTSQLLGFKQAMMKTLFADVPDQPRVLQVGPEYSIATAAGALAHILHETYKPARFRVPAGSDDIDTVFTGELPADVVFALKRAGGKETDIVALRRDDDLVDIGGTRLIDGMPPLREDERVQGRLVPSIEIGKKYRKNMRPRRLSVKQAPGKIHLAWNPDTREARVESTQVNNTASLFLDTKTLHGRNQAAKRRYDGDVADDESMVDEAPDVVLDLGMSKTVAVTARAGVVSPALLRSELSGTRIRQPTRSPASGRRRAPTDATAAMPTSNPAMIPASDPAATVDSAERLSVPTMAVTANTVLVQGATAAAEQPSQPTRGQATVSLPGPREKRPVTTGPFAERLAEVVAKARELDIHLPVGELTTVLLALATRPLVLLAGPPGCGKSTLVRIIAHLLGTEPGQTFHEVPVQAHWTDDRPLFEPGQGRLAALLCDGPSAVEDDTHLVLFDEFNLTRPEYYLSRFFHAQESTHRQLGARTLRACLLCGTLNIDDTSRPPSPKVTDRCFLVEVAPIPIAAYRQAVTPDTVHKLPRLGRLPHPDHANGLTADTQAELDAIFKAIETAVYEHNLRQDLLPSRRAVHDVYSFLTLHEQLSLDDASLLSREDAVDAVLNSRVLVKFSGAAEQVTPLLESLEAVLGQHTHLKRCNRRVALARQQLSLGFVSPWQ